MIKQHSQFLTVMMAGCDLICIGVACIASYLIGVFVFPQVDAPKAVNLLTEFCLVELVSLIALHWAGLYKPRRDKSFLLELGQILKAAAVIWVLLIVLIYYVSTATAAVRPMLTAFLPISIAALILERGFYRAALRFVRRRGWNLRHALIIGTGRLAQSTAITLRRNSWTGIHVNGFIASDLPLLHTGSHIDTLLGMPILGHVDDLSTILERTPVDAVFLALPTQQHDLLRNTVAALEKAPVDVRIIPDLFLSRFPAQVGFTDLDGLPILCLRENPFEGWPAVYKRLFDVIGASVGLLLLSVPMLLIALIIKLIDRGPVFYRQDRLSYGRRTFKMIKFRTMGVDAESTGPAFTRPSDPRCTGFGRWLRSISLDELPQLFNVLTGDMSLVGPRPERPEMLHKIQEEVPEFPCRLQVRGGLTGWAQVHGYRGRTSFRKRLQYDLYYLNHWSPLLDLRIVLTTLFRSFRHPNAY